MQSRTVVCVYGKNESVETIAKRLSALYTSNYSKSYMYGAIIDLPDAISYRIAGDLSTEEKAKRMVEYMSGRYNGNFFCAVRQRRICEDSERRYACEEGEKGALKALWRYIKGKRTELFPFFGCVAVDGAERVYLSAETLPIKHNEKDYIEVIEPNGIFALADDLNESGAVFASKSGTLNFEALFTSDELDRMLSCGYIENKSTVCENVKIVRYGENKFASPSFLL